MDDWTANALFSPSKARAQQAQAKDWAAVEAWLSRRYNSRIPNFERNEDTLQALLTLANLNETADEQRIAVERVQKSALSALGRQPDGVQAEVMRAVEAEMQGEANLDVLAEVSVVLSCPNGDVGRIGNEMVDMGVEEFEVLQQIKRAEAQLEALKREQKRLASILEELRGDDFQAPTDIVEDTAEWTRLAKHLKAKVAEYEERLGASRGAAKGVEMRHLEQKMKDTEEQRETLCELEEELRAFQDLPADARTARAEVERAREGLRRLTTKRDRLFEGLVDPYNR
jgi:HAUS augmin-like complex subunit 1